MKSLTTRIQSNGYAPTSITGAYSGMFVRDAACEVMALCASGEYENARKILNYIFKFHIDNSYNYALHVIGNDGSSIISSKLQADTSFMLVHAWCMYYNNAPASSAKSTFIEYSKNKAKVFAEYYLSVGDFYNSTLKLLRNPSFEHSRDGCYFNAYDLITNVFASQALHELSIIYRTIDANESAIMNSLSNEITWGINHNLVDTVDGKTVYAEMQSVSKIIATTGNEVADSTFYTGFSWVNFAPVAAEWYAMDPEIMENTYQAYLKYGSRTYFSKYTMLEAVSTYLNGAFVRLDSSYVIGKGVAWEIMYCKMTGKTARLKELCDFYDHIDTEYFFEVWELVDRGSDLANQEHASWQVYAFQYAFNFADYLNVRVGTYNIHHLEDVSFDAGVIAGDIRSAGIKICGLQEVDKNVGRSGNTNQAKLIADELGWYYAFSKAMDLDGGDYGVALISEYPIISYETVNLPSSGEQRICLDAVVNINGNNVHVLNTHLAFGDSTQTTNQFNTLGSTVSGYGKYIMTGDFNTTDFSAYSPLSGTLANNSTTTFTTCPDDGAIDNVVVGGGLALDNAAMSSAVHSDHYLLYVDVHS